MVESWAGRDPQDRRLWARGAVQCHKLHHMHPDTGSGHIYMVIPFKLLHQSRFGAESAESTPWAHTRKKSRRLRLWRHSASCHERARTPGPCRYQGIGTQTATLAVFGTGLGRPRDRPEPQGPSCRRSALGRGPDAEVPGACTGRRCAGAVRGKILAEAHVSCTVRIDPLNIQPVNAPDPVVFVVASARTSGTPFLAAEASARLGNRVRCL